MSGTFMDGGGHDHGGHAVHSGHGGDGGGFMDGGQQNHHHGMHMGGDGGGGLNIASLLGLNQQGHHSFLSHILGLDHNTHHGAHGHSGMQSGAVHNPSQSPMWSSALQGVKLSNFFQGITISANAWLAIMFMGFISWLFVLYFIRHHEPFANAVLGSSAAQSPTADFDRRMIANVKEAFPLHTPNMGLYAPSPPARTAPPGSASAAPLPATYMAPSAFAPMPVQTLTPVLPSTGYPAPNPGATTFAAGPFGQPIAGNNFYQSPPSQFNSATPYMNVPQYLQYGTRLRSIVSR
jgi:hypothetical protein